jgi:two-component system, NtrC family, sensor histidine kinase HydH
MVRRRLTTWGAVLAGWCALAAWQHHEYCREREAAQETVRRQAESVMNALVSGIRSHRRVGQFFEEQVQVVLEELVKSKDVLAAAVASPQGQLLMSSGRVDGLRLSPKFEAGESWEPLGYRLVADFRLPSEVAGGGAGGGRGSGFGGGRGRGLGPWWQTESDTPGAFALGGRYAAILLLDRTRADEHCRRAAWSRSSVAVAGSLLVLCVAIVWRMTVRLAAAKGVLEAETRHLQELSQAAAGLAHETRNPLGLIRGWAQRLAQADLGAAEQQQQAQSLVEECDRVTSRINQFLAFARPNAPKVESLNPRTVAEELTVLLQPDLDAKNLTLQRAMPAAAEKIAADREMFRQALFNLLQNAVQWSPEGGTVEILLQRGHNGRWRMEVADRGPGVPADAASCLFSPYFTTRVSGTGLGLAIVRRIAVAHGWGVGYTRRPGGGAIFWVDGIHG